MLAAKNLERLMEVEADLKSRYEGELNDKSAQLEDAVKKHEVLESEAEKLRAKIADQLEQIKRLSAVSSDTRRIEQLNRELEARSSKLQDEYDVQKKRVKSLQKELAIEREENKSLKQFDAKKLKANLITNKKKLAEKATANDLLQKSNSKLKRENEEFKAKVKELEAKLASLEAQDQGEVQEASLAPEKT